MTRLILIRHAKAEQAAPGEHDVDRHLSERGHADAGAAIPMLRGIEMPSPVTVLVSPAVRTQETYDAIASGLPDHTRMTPERLYEAGVSTVLDLVSTDVVHVDAHPGTVIVIGHNPTMGDVVRHLTGEPIASFPTCGIAVLDGSLADAASGTWSLVSMDVPRAPQPS